MPVPIPTPPPPRPGKVLNSAGVFVQPWSGWFRNLYNVLLGNKATLATQAGEIATLTADVNAGLTVTITTAALTSVGTEGSMHFTKGILTAQTPAT